MQWIYDRKKHGDDPRLILKISDNKTQPWVAKTPLADLHETPDAETPLQTQLLYGEQFNVAEIKDSWAYGYAQHDHFVGYIMVEHLQERPDKYDPNQTVLTGTAPVRLTNDKKSGLKTTLFYGSRFVTKGRAKNDAVGMNDGGFVSQSHIKETDLYLPDPVSESFRFLGAPYLWGGRSILGLDCSGLVQLVFATCGQFLPRDTDLMLRSDMGQDINHKNLEAGDLVFFKGHVAIAVDQETIIHASMKSEAVGIDGLSDYMTWRGNHGQEPDIIAIKRLL